MTHSFKNKVAVITGAASGIGRALAKLLASHGANVAISDVNEEGLNQTADFCRAKGIKVHTHILDVSNRDDFEAYAKMVHDEFGQVDIIVNNAGVSLSSRIDEMEQSDFEWVMNINFWGVTYGTKAFLPYIKQSKNGHIVNVSSVFGLIAVNTQAAYNAAKFAIRGYTECLMQELALTDKNVNVHCVMPGGIKTNIVRNGRLKDTSMDMTPEQVIKEFDKALAKTTPEQAAEVIVKGLQSKKKHILIGPDAHAIYNMKRIMPIGYQKMLSRFDQYRLKRMKRHNAKKT